MTPIVFITDNNYFVATIVAIESLIENNEQVKGEQIYVLTVDLSDEYLKLITNYDCRGSALNVIQVKKKNYEIQQLENQYVTVSALVKFDIPQILKEYDKILYLDGDIIVRNNLDELLNTDVKGYYAAVIKDIECMMERQDHLRLKHDNYFNSGVMLLNAKKIREEKLSEKMLIEKKNNKNLHYMDQDVFNVIFNQNVKFLDISYNYMMNYDYYSPKVLLSNSYKNYTDFNDLENSIVILHLSGRCKPWNCEKTTYTEEWNKYYKNSIVRGVDLKYKKHCTKKGIITKEYISNEITKVRVLRIPIIEKMKTRNFDIYTLLNVIKIKSIRK